MKAIAQQGGAAQSAAKSGHAYLTYMNSTWMPEALWQSWSQRGRTVAATLLKISVEGVLPTTNHLESFNCLLKRKYIRQWQRSGARLRFDFLIHVLISKILPEIFALRRSQGMYAMWLSARFSQSAGGVNLAEKGVTKHDIDPSSSPHLYWYALDKRRDDEALGIVVLRRVYNIKFPNHDLVEATCAASSASMEDPHHPRYTQWMHRAGLANCSCSDFMLHGGACKHLRALRHIVLSWVAQNLLPPFYHPTSLDDARQVLHSLKFTTPNPGNKDQQAQDASSLLTNLFALRQIACATADDLSDASSAEELVDAGVDVVESDDGDEDQVFLSTPVQVGVEPLTIQVTHFSFAGC